MAPSPLTLLERIRTAQNRHDLTAFLDCFASDYQSEQPLHPGAGFSGREQVRKNWEAMFGGVPDFHSELLQSATSGDRVWAEWRWHGTRHDGQTLDLRGVTIFEVRDDQIVRARLFMEPVQAPDVAIDAQVRQRLGER